MMAEQGTDLYVQQNAIRSHVTSNILRYYFSKTIVSFLPDPWPTLCQVVGHSSRVVFGFNHKA